MCSTMYCMCRVYLDTHFPRKFELCNSCCRNFLPSVVTSSRDRPECFVASLTTCFDSKSDMIKMACKTAHVSVKSVCQLLSLPW